MEWNDIYLRITKDLATDEEKMKFFSEEYQALYTGDMEAFLNLRQKQTIEKYKAFLVETIAFLNTENHKYSKYLELNMAKRAYIYIANQFLK